MNCKQGDLAIFVRSEAGNEGKIVRCLRLAVDSDFRYVRYKKTLGPVWVIDCEIPHYPTGFLLPFAIDAHLRPIRDPGDDAQDETLQWLDVPSKETV